MAGLKHASALDRFKFYHDRVTYYRISDPECAQKQKLNYPSLSYQHHKKLAVYHADINETTKSDEILKFVNLAYCESKPTW
jgi:hypothetical protein